MTQANPNATAPLPLECEMCLKEIPASAAFTPEGSEYVGHFCGIDCYQAFLRLQREAAEKPE
ncbi:MAG: hypothetical protein EFKGCFLK_01173 [Rhodocyclaceae bacterium]|nr:MAG: DUF3330 domain-containing protein [Rhodocyclaceae bacterium]MBE7423987.1 DUF3330 domain-containing protein [Zoogloeaceae bacterium]MBV6407606.1 hypothetical protein [Rhodocyclaceae bacterium]CAG0930194.1 hypothetical protein RHDC3_01424 [Rhodocyclaceae bacterium]